MRRSPSSYMDQFVPLDAYMESMAILCLSLLKTFCCDHLQRPGSRPAVLQKQQLLASVTRVRQLGGAQKMLCPLIAFFSALPRAF